VFLNVLDLTAVKKKEEVLIGLGPNAYRSLSQKEGRRE
jgi:hypothetical protein